MKLPWVLGKSHLHSLDALVNPPFFWDMGGCRACVLAFLHLTPSSLGELHLSSSQMEPTERISEAIFFSCQFFPAVPQHPGDQHFQST
jgi:hypothetical protein